MKIPFTLLVGSLVIVFVLSGPAVMAAGSKEARVTQIVREVKLLPSDAAAREAAVNDKVTEDTGVRTGGESRSELTFADLTITRLGANTVFSFSKAGRTANLDSGSLLLRVPKDSGGGSIRSSAVTVAVTGTTVIFETGRGGKSKLITLEGSSRIALKSKPGDFRKVLAGQMIDVPPGATTLPMPVNIDLKDLMRTHPLITDFRPLPSLPLIMAAAEQPPSGPRGPVIVTRPPRRGPGPNPTPSPTPPNQPPGPKPPGPGKPPGKNPPKADSQPTPQPTPVILKSNPNNPQPTPKKVQKARGELGVPNS
jgi:hypothetical protein